MSALRWLEAGASGSYGTVVEPCNHPAKFPDAVEAASNVRPPLPEHLADLFDRPERFEVCPNDFVTVRGRIEEILDQS
jgi:threonine synthase